MWFPGQARNSPARGGAARLRNRVHGSYRVRGKDKIVDKGKMDKKYVVDADPEPRDGA